MHLTTNENLKERIASVKRSIAAGHFLPYEMRGVRAALRQLERELRIEEIRGFGRRMA
jgi:hypothetical protein